MFDKFIFLSTGSRTNYGQANSRCLVINGQSSCITHTNMMKRIHGKVFYRALYWSRLVDVACDMGVMCSPPSAIPWTAALDIQTYFYLPEFCGKGSQGNEIRKCPNTWDVLCNSSIHRLRCYAGGISFLFEVITYLYLSHTGKICSVFVKCVQQERYHNGLRTVLQQYSRDPWAPRWDCGSWPFNGLVEPVRCI